MINLRIRTNHRLRTLARHSTVIVAILAVTFSGTWPAGFAGASDTPPPAPLTSQKLSLSETPERLLLAAHPADEEGWASTSDDTWERTADGTRIIEPEPTVIDDVRYIPYRVWMRDETYAVEFPSSLGKQLIEFPAASLSYTLFEKPLEDTSFIRLAQQTLGLQFRIIGETPALEPTPGSESSPVVSPDPEPTESVTPLPSPELSATPAPEITPEITPDSSVDEPSAFLQFLGVRSAHATDGLTYAWYPAAVTDITTSLTYGSAAVVVTQDFKVDIGGVAHVGSVSARIGFDGNPINKWTYSVAGDETDIVMRAVTLTALDGTAERTDDRSGSRFTMEISQGDEVMLDWNGTTTVETPEPVRSTVPESSAQPSPTFEVSPSATPGSAEPTPTPVTEVSSTPLPTVEITPVPAENGSTAEPLPPEQTPAPQDEPPAVTAPEAPPEPPTGMLQSIIRWLIPTAYAADSNVSDEHPGFIDTIVHAASNLLSSDTRTFTVMLQSDGIHVPQETFADGVATTLYSMEAAERPAGKLLYVDPGIGAQQDTQGITVQSGDGTRSSDFKIHFNPSLGGSVDELYLGGDYTLNRVSAPASDSGGLTLINGDTPQSSRQGELSISETGTVRVIVHNELPGLTEDYAIYPSGRVAKRSVLDSQTPQPVTFLFSGAASAFDANIADQASKTQLISSGSGPDMVMAWEDSSSLASASFAADQTDSSYVNRTVTTLPAGQTTLHQLFELSQQGLTPIDASSYMPYTDDWRNPDSPVMTRGTFQGFSAARAAYQMEAVNNVAVFRLDGSVHPRINPTFEISSWSDPDLDAFKAQLNGHNMQEGVDYVIGFQNSDSSTGILLFQYLHTVQVGDVFSAQGDESLPPLFDLDPTDGAAIRRVQRGEISMAVGVTAASVTLPIAVVTSRSMVIAGDNFGAANGNVSNPEESRNADWLANTTTLRFNRENSTSVATKSWEVVEFVDSGSGSTAGAFVQRGSQSFAVGDTSFDITLPHSVTTNKAFALVTVRAATPTQTIDEEWTVRASLSATTLNLSRNESGIALVASWQVVQLDGISVQRGLTTSTGANVSNVTLPTSVNVNKSFIIMSERAAGATNGDDGQYHFMARLTSSTNLRFTKDDATNGADIAWFVVTFTGNSGNRVRTGTDTYTASLTDSTHNESVSPAVTATRSMSYMTAAGATTAGDTADLDATTFGIHSLNTAGSSLTATRFHTGNARTASISWQVIEFTRPNIQQNRYRWRNDNGSETAATWAAAENTSISMAFNTIYRLRFGLYDSDSGSATNQYRLSFVRKAAGGSCATGLSAGWSWRDIPVTPSGASDSFDIENSLNITEGAATTNVAGGLTDDDTTFVAGDTRDTSNQSASIGLASTSFTEIEYSLRANSNALAGGKYCFRLTDAGDANASKSFIFYPRYAETTIAATPTYTQNTFRWYVNTNAVSPTDPWTSGGSDMDENQNLDAQFSPPGSGSFIRLRMSVQDGAGPLGLRAASFSLQFAEVPVGSFLCSAVASWTDVAASTSTAAAWSFGSNAGVTSGVSAGSLLLTTSDRLGTYQESNPTALNPASASAGEDIEYDFALRNVNAAASSRFCFRMSTPQGAALSSYTYYPSMVTQPSPYKMEDVMRHGTFFSVQGEKQPYYWSEIF